MEAYPIITATCLENAFVGLHRWEAVEVGEWRNIGHGQLSRKVLEKCGLCGEGRAVEQLDLPAVPLNCWLE